MTREEINEVLLWFAKNYKDAPECVLVAWSILDLIGPPDHYELRYPPGGAHCTLIYSAPMGAVMVTIYWMKLLDLIVLGTLGQHSITCNLKHEPTGTNKHYKGSDFSSLKEDLSNLLK